MSYRENPNIDGDLDAERSNETQARLMGLLMAVLLIPLWLLVAHFTNEPRGFLVVCVFLVFAAILYALRQKALRPRLLLAILVLFGAELGTALVVPLPTRMPGYIMVGLSTVDCVALLWLLSFIDRSIRANNEDGPRYSE